MFTFIELCVKVQGHTTRSKVRFWNEKWYRWTWHQHLHDRLDSV